MRTYAPNEADIERAWHVVDADGLVLGRMATEVASILRGKHKPTFADKVELTSNKAERKPMYSHSGYPGGLKETTYAAMMDKDPADAVRGSVRGMIPKNSLGRRMLSKLQVYTSTEFQDQGGHPHAAQKPQPLAIEHARAR